MPRWLCIGLTLAGAGAPGTAFAQMRPLKPDEKFDLVIKGGEVTDPNRRLCAKRDIGIKSALVFAVIVGVLNTAELRKLLAARDFQPVGSAPRQFAAFVKAEIEKYARLVKETGIKIDD